MRFGIIKPKDVKTEIVDVASMDYALKLAGLTRGQTDHGHIAQNLHVVVYEFGLFVPPEETAYFAIGSSMGAGNAVLYATDERGETVDLKAMPPVFFFGSVEAIEQAIRVGQINRPEIRMNNELLWAWPQKAPWGPYAGGRA